jgi:hypothetical protein
MYFNKCTTKNAQLVARNHLLDRHSAERARVVILALHQCLAAVANAMPARNDCSKRRKSEIKTRSTKKRQKNLSTPAGFEPARAEPRGFLVRRLNHSATVSCCCAIGRECSHPTDTTTTRSRYLAFAYLLSLLSKQMEQTLSSIIFEAFSRKCLFSLRSSLNRSSKHCFKIVSCRSSFSWPSLFLVLFMLRTNSIISQI